MGQEATSELDVATRTAAPDGLGQESISGDGYARFESKAQIHAGSSRFTGKPSVTRS